MKKIISALKRGKYIVFVDDKLDAPVDAVYLEKKTVAIADDRKAAEKICEEYQEKERKERGRAFTRYRISDGKSDYVCTEDLEAEDVISIAEKLPLSQEDREKVVSHLKKKR